MASRYCGRNRERDYPADMSLHVERVAEAAEFLAKTQVFRHAQPLETNVLGSVPQSVIDGSRHYATMYWWIVLDGDTVVGCAVHTPHYRPVLSPMSDEAARMLADAVFAVQVLPASRARPQRPIFLCLPSGFRSLALRHSVPFIT